MIEMDMPKIEVEENEDKSYAKIVVEPLEKGFGLTIGNCLRRILLSALPGAAVQGIRFLDGSVKHEFSAVAGVKEDVTEIILNLKLLAITTKVTDKDYTKVLHLYKEGPCVITGADIEQDAEIEVVNKDQYICTVDEGGKVDVEITIGRGRGYKPASENKQPIIDYIAIDSIYTPVQKVNYQVENARVGQNLNYDRLNLEVWTDGTFSAKEIVSLSAKIMQDHTSLFVNLSDTIRGMDILVKNEDDKQQQVLAMAIEDMDLSVRSYNCLKRASIHTVDGLQGSYGRGEATEKSDIDIVVILDELSPADIKTYNTMLDTLPNRELICGFLSGKSEILNWESSDLFQFYYDTKPIKGSLDELLPKITETAVNRAIRIGACNIYHGCVHNMLYEKSEEILRGLYKSASFLVQAIAFQQIGKYISHQKDLLEIVSADERAIVETFLSLKNSGAVEFDKMSEVLFLWSKNWIVSTEN